MIERGTGWMTYAHALEPLVLLHRIVDVRRQEALAVLALLSLGGSSRAVVDEFAEELDGGVDEGCLAFRPLGVGRKRLAEVDHEALERGAVDEDLEHGVCKAHVACVDEASGVYFLWRRTGPMGEQAQELVFVRGGDGGR